MIVPKINVDKSNFSSIEEKLGKLKKHAIAHQNWTNYTDYPKVTFQIAHDGENIYLRFDIKEKEIRAIATEKNGLVWEDSCVEFFISFDDSDYYYNLEQNCIATPLLGYRKKRKESERATPQTLNLIRSQSSLGSQSFDIKQGNFSWTLISIIPSSLFWKSNIKSFDKLRARANFYKCGDKLTQPHFLSWNPIETEKPDFHKINFFKEVIFE